jgi:hypothetical protein
MVHRRLSLAASSALLFAAACAPAGSSPASTTPAPDRVLVIDANGQPIRRAEDDAARVSFDAPIDKVWPARVVVYAELGIEPTVVDRATGRYGNTSFYAPRRIAGRPLGDFFSCGQGLTGPLIDAGRLTANVVTTLQAQPGGTTRATTYTGGTLRKNEGTSTGPVTCSSTGALEEYLRNGIAARIGKP